MIWRLFFIDNDEHDDLTIFVYVCVCLVSYLCLTSRSVCLSVYILNYWFFFKMMTCYKRITKRREEERRNERMNHSFLDDRSGN